MRRISINGYRSLRREYLLMTRDLMFCRGSKPRRDLQRVMAMVRRDHLPYLLGDIA